MVKNRIEQDENDLLETQWADESAFENSHASRFSETDEAENLLEIPGLTIDPPSISQMPKTAVQAADTSQPVETQIEETKPEVQAEDIEEIQPESDVETIYQSPAEPESIGETARKSGLAYGAAVTLFGSVIFLLALGWLADWLLGTSPWGIILGIVLGAAIGFYQFFRITSQIFKNKD